MNLLDAAKAATGYAREPDPQAGDDAEQLRLTTPDGDLLLRAVGNGWTLDSPQRHEPISPLEALEVAAAVRGSATELPRGWVIGQTRRLVAQLADRLASRAAASAVSDNYAQVWELRQYAEAIGPLLTGLDAIAMGDVL
jgi:hypothetical protein